MALSDCIKCWQTPCECGYEYREWSWERINEFISTIVKAKIEYEREKENDTRSKDS